MALKYALKLIFLKFIFEFMINLAPPTSNSVHGGEKCIKYNNFKVISLFCTAYPLLPLLYEGHKFISLWLLGATLFK